MSPDQIPPRRRRSCFRTSHIQAAGWHRAAATSHQTAALAHTKDQSGLASPDLQTLSRQAFVASETAAWASAAAASEPDGKGELACQLAGIAKRDAEHSGLGWRGLSATSHQTTSRVHLFCAEWHEAAASGLQPPVWSPHPGIEGEKEDYWARA